LRLLHEGQAPKEVAEIMAVSQPIVYDWHHRWQKNGYVERLEEVIEQDPQEGYNFTIWTADRLRYHMEKETGKLIGPTQFRALLKENDFVYRRPKHDLTDLQDPQARKAAEEWLNELKKAPKQERSTFS
jgi:transposase